MLVLRKLRFGELFVVVLDLDDLTRIEAVWIGRGVAYRSTLEAENLCYRRRTCRKRTLRRQRENTIGAHPGRELTQLLERGSDLLE
jgi:hypothetical protein